MKAIMELIESGALTAPFKEMDQMNAQIRPNWNGVSITESSHDRIN